MYNPFAHVSYVTAISSLAFASPDYVSGSCPGLVTYCAEVFAAIYIVIDKSLMEQFDSLNASTRVPDGYDGMLWNGFTTVDPVASYAIQGPNGPDALAIQAPSFEGSSIAFQTGLGELYSFYFACAGLFKGFNNRLPEVCSVQVVAVANFGISGISTYGPFTSTVNYTSLQQRVPAEMTQVTVNATASTFYIYLTAGSSDSILLLSNPYYVTQC